MKVRKITINPGEDISKILTSILGEALNEIELHETACNSNDTEETEETVERYMDFTNDLMDLARSYEMDPTDVIASITSVIFSNSCIAAENKGKRVEPHKLLDTHNKTGLYTLELMESNFRGQSFSDKILALLNAVMILTVNGTNHELETYDRFPYEEDEEEDECGMCCQCRHDDAPKQTEGIDTEEIVEILRKLKNALLV